MLLPSFLSIFPCFLTFCRVLHVISYPFAKACSRLGSAAYYISGSILINKTVEIKAANCHSSSDDNTAFTNCGTVSSLATGESKPWRPYCSPGAYSTSNSAECHMCAIGTFQAEYGQTFCEVCPEGSACPVCRRVPSCWTYACMHVCMYVF